TIKPGPQIDRFTSAPASGFTSLADESVILKFRQGEEKVAGRSAAKTEGASVPPTRAAKPKTEAVETDAAIQSPSPVKVRSNGEKRASVKAPEEDPVEA